MKKYRYFLLFFLALSLLPACRVVPIQMARVVQIDTYEHWYEIKDETHADKVFREILGKKNWDAFILYCGDIIDVLKDLREKKIVVQGSVIITMSLVPEDHDKFFIEGLGRYYVVRKSTNEIMFSATYYITENIHSIKSLERNGKIEIEMKQHLIRHFAPEKPNYFHDAPLKFRMYIKAVKDQVFSFDYSRNHELVVNGEIVGYLKFKEPKSGSKLLDMRGLNLIRNDY